MDGKASPVSFLNGLKAGPRRPLPDEPEPPGELLGRIDAGGPAEIRVCSYFHFKGRDVCLRLPLHYLTLTQACGAVRLYWLELGGGRAFALRLGPGEVTAIAELFRVPELLTHLRRPVSVAGFGPFELRDFRPGEPIYSERGELVRVARVGGAGDGVPVWRDPESARPRRELWLPATPAFATSREQEARVTKRLAERARRAKQRHA
jgi:hypothetical protein